MRDWLITTGAGFLGGTLGVGVALLLMQVAGAIDPFSPLAYLFLLALPLLSGLGVIGGCRLAESFIEKRTGRN